MWCVWCVHGSQYSSEVLQDEEGSEHDADHGMREVWLVPRAHQENDYKPCHGQEDTSRLREERERERGGGKGKEGGEGGERRGGRRGEGREEREERGEGKGGEGRGGEGRGGEGRGGEGRGGEGRGGEGREGRGGEGKGKGGRGGREGGEGGTSEQAIKRDKHTDTKKVQLLPLLSPHFLPPSLPLLPPLSLGK